MRWVEIMGPHGIGKTTLVKRIRKRPGMARLRIKNEVVAPFIEGKNFNRPTTWGFANDWRPFLEVVESLYRESTGGSNPPDLKRRRNLCRSIFRMSMVQKAAGVEITPRDIIGSEGMRLSFVLRDPSRIASYFQTMPVSVGVIMLEADLDTIVRRNRERSHKVEDFGEFAKQGVRACTIAAEVLAQRTRLLRIDATRPVDEITDAIYAFCRES